MDPNLDLFRFIHRQNIEHFRKLLVEAKDCAQRQSLLKLLAEEETKLPYDLETIKEFYH